MVSNKDNPITSALLLRYDEVLEVNKYDCADGVATAIVVSATVVNTSTNGKI